MKIADFLKTQYFVIAGDKKILVSDYRSLKFDISDDVQVIGYLGVVVASKKSGETLLTT